MLNLKVGTIVELLLGLYLFNKVGCVLSFTIYSLHSSTTVLEADCIFNIL